MSVAASAGAAPARARPISKIGVTVTAMIAMISMIMSSTMVNVAIPDVMGAFGIGQDQAHWMATGFLTAMTVSMLLNAWLVTNWGPRNVFLGAVAVFSVAAALGFESHGYTGMVAARVVQGMCAGLIQPLAMSTVFLVYAPEERGRAMGWFGMGVVLGPTIGPTLGGLIVDNADWRYVFLAPVPIMTLSAVLAWIYLPGRDDSAHRAKMNFISFALITAAVTLFLNGITTGQREGWETRETFLLLFGSASSLLLFLLRESSSDAPLIQIKLFSYWTYSASALLAFVFGMGMFGSIYLAPIMTQTIQGFTASKSGLMLIPGGIVAMMIFPMAGRFAQAVPPTLPICVGLITFAASCLWQSYADMLTGFWTLAVAIALGRAGLGLVIPALNTGAMAAVPRELVTYAAGTLNFIRMTGATIGVNALAIILTHRAAVHGEALLASQTAANPVTRELLDRVAGRLTATGLAEGDRANAALGYLDRLLTLKATELSFHDGFQVMTCAFLVGVPISFLLLRGRNKAGQPGKP